MNTSLITTLIVGGVIAVLLRDTAPAENLPTSQPHISVYPARTFLELKTNESYKGTFLITNESSETIKVRVVAEDWSELGKEVRSGNPEGWLTFEKPELLIQPSQKANLSYKILLPPETKGQKMAQVFFEPTYDLPGTGPLLTRSGVLITALAKGTEKLQIGNIRATLSYTQKSHKPSLELTLQNLGNVYLKWQADLQVMDSKNNLIGENRFQSVQSLLKGETKTSIATLTEALPKNKKNLVAKISLQYGMQNITEANETLVVPVEVIQHE